MTNYDVPMSETPLLHKRRKITLSRVLFFLVILAATFFYLKYLGFAALSELTNRLLDGKHVAASDFGLIAATAITYVMSCLTICCLVRIIKPLEVRFAQGLVARLLQGALVSVGCGLLCAFVFTYDAIPITGFALGYLLGTSCSLVFAPIKGLTEEFRYMQ